MNEEVLMTLRLECLKTAERLSGLKTVESVISDAEKLMNFILTGE